jgi:hypothetical protein
LVITDRKPSKSKCFIYWHYPNINQCPSNPTSTTARSATDNKGKQLEVLTLRKRNVDDKKVNKLGSFYKT